MRITALAENTAHDPAIGCEHGLSLYIETDSRVILFDMGQTELFAKNAEKLGIDLKKVDFAVLSHGHYDHGGGMKRFLQLNSCAPVYISRHAFEPHYNGKEKYIGLNTALSSSERLIFTDEEYKIADGLTLCACNDIQRVCDTDSGELTVMRDGRLIPEDFIHEQYLLIEENDKRVLISGCSHKGILNIVDRFKPDVLVGGFHFMKMELDGRLLDYAKRLNEYPTEFYTCHCTGAEQYDYMKPHMERLHYLYSGKTIEI